ncbi:MAG: hypothetical protein WDO71_26265 [Bacteroidota bacterium]
MHNPYANATHEHYCRRWVSINSLNHISELVAKKKYKQPIVEAQISQYWQTHNRYLCISIAKPAAKGSDEIVSVTIGFDDRSETPANNAFCKRYKHPRKNRAYYPVNVVALWTAWKGPFLLLKI